MAAAAAAPPWLDDADLIEQKYEEAVAKANRECAESTAGQECYICMGPGDEEEGLVRMCACCGTLGFAHVSCLAEHPRRLVEEAERMNWRELRINIIWAKWHTCGVCRYRHRGVVGRGDGAVHCKITAPLGRRRAAPGASENSSEVITSPRDTHCKNREQCSATAGGDVESICEALERVTPR